MKEYTANQNEASYDPRRGEPPEERGRALTKHLKQNEAAYEKHVQATKERPLQLPPLRRLPSKA